MLHKLAAVKVIQELEEQETYYGSTIARMLRPLRNIKQEITNLALNHGKPCKRCNQFSLLTNISPATSMPFLLEIF